MSLECSTALLSRIKITLYSVLLIDNSQGGKQVMRAQMISVKSAGILLLLMAYGLCTDLRAAPSVVCSAAFGAKFNLEPNSHTVPQQLEVVDFIPNRIGPNEDLVVGGAYDFRGAGLGSPAPKGVVWDGSVSGYYVHRSTTTDCSAQFEGGLPAIVSQGTTYLGNGGVAIAADPPRDAFFAADLRFGATNNVSAVGLFRASSATLLNSTFCPNGTHTAAQAKACWEATPPVVLDPNPPGSLTATLDFPSLTVDERATNAGVGAGDVYVAFEKFNVTTGGIILIACANATLSCSTPLIISNGAPEFGSVDAHVQVRPDGNITVTYVDQNSPPSNTIHFVMCTPRGAPNAPVCSPPAVVANENQALGPSISGGSLSGLNLPVFTAARHSDRLESDGKTISTFVVWDRCQTPLQSSSGGFSTCLNAQVVMSLSSDGGTTWSAPVPVNTSPGHQFFPWISTDTSTNTVNIVYYNTSPDFFHKRIVVSLNQIDAGSTTVGAPATVTSSPAPWDADPTQNPLAIGFDFHFGMKARGTGITGQSGVYTSFTSTADRRGVYSGSPLPEQNNNLQKLAY
jgi:hypothetical protein